MTPGIKPRAFGYDVNAVREGIKLAQVVHISGRYTRFLTRLPSREGVKRSIILRRKADIYSDA